MIRLFTKSYGKDFEWLQMAVRTVLKFCTEPVSWTIVIEDADTAPTFNNLMGDRCSDWVFRIQKVSDFWPEAMEIQNGYLRQQWVKMNAHRVMGNNLFWHWDSDLMAVKPFGAYSFMGAGRPVYWFSQLNSIIDAANPKIYHERADVMKELIGLKEISFEWMRCLPIPSHGQILAHGANTPVWDGSFNKMKNGDNRFSEFNVIGQFSHLYFPDAYEWRNTQNYAHTWGGQPNDAHAIVSQGWSWGGVTEELRKFIDSL